MALPRIAVVGRPNVGKSSLVNWLAGQRISVVDAAPGTTRDRVSALIDREGFHFEMTDTGGLGVKDRDGLTADIERQVAAAIAEADAVVFLVDIRAGVTDMDRAVARRLRAAKLAVVVAANKADSPSLDAEAATFHALGFGEPIPISAVERRGLEELLEALAPNLDREAKPQEPDFRVAIVGPRNAGKSTMVNALAKSERVIVSEIPGTTRDAVDVAIRKDARTIVLVDTAGFRRRAKVSGSFEFYAQQRAEEALHRADVACLLLDVTQKVGKVEKQLAEAVARGRRPCVIVANKYDLAKEKVETETLGKYLRAKLPMLDFAPIIFTTALTGHNALAMLDLAAMLHKHASRRVGTGPLNRVLLAAVARRGPPRKGGRDGRLYYGTQTGTRPPEITCFVNAPECFAEAYERYLGHQLRDAGLFVEVPIRFHFRERRRGGSPKDAALAAAVEGEEGDEA